MTKLHTRAADMPTTEQLLRDLVEALDGAFISSWQSTAAWQTQLDAARDHLTERAITGEKP